MGEHVHSFGETPAKFQGGANTLRGASYTALTVDDIKISERSNETIEAVRPLNVYDINHSIRNEQRLLRRGNQGGRETSKKGFVHCAVSLEPKWHVGPLDSS